jgi:hypothetical protein
VITEQGGAIGLPVANRRPPFLAHYPVSEYWSRIAVLLTQQRRYEDEWALRGPLGGVSRAIFGLLTTITMIPYLLEYPDEAHVSQTKISSWACNEMPWQTLRIQHGPEQV